MISVLVKIEFQFPDQAENIAGKEKMLDSSIFSFSINVYKSPQSQGCENQGPYSQKLSQEHSLSFSPRFANWNVTQLLIG